MATATETPARDAKLVQYLNEAYGKERELETALRAHISMTTRDTYKKRLQAHLKETQQQAKGLERRIKALGGKAERGPDVPGPDAVSDVATAATALASKAVSAAKGPLHMIRGTGEAEKLLKNAKTELWNEFEEIGNYIAIEELATSLGDKETAKLAREFRKQEERMASFLQKLIPTLTKQVVKDEIPAAERRAATNGNASRARRTTSGNGSRSTSSRSTSSRSTSPRSTAKTSSRSNGSTKARSTGAAKTRSTSSAKRSTAGRTRSAAKK